VLDIERGSLHSGDRRRAEEGRRGRRTKAEGMDRRTTIRWDRLGRWALIGVFAFVLYLYIGPAARWVTTYHQAKEKRAEVALLQTENRRLRAQERDLKRPSALEREARRLGMVKAGEKSYVVEGLPGR
jgi:cell division protein FtsB